MYWTQWWFDTSSTNHWKLLVITSYPLTARARPTFPGFWYSYFSSPFLALQKSDRSWIICTVSFRTDSHPYNGLGQTVSKNNFSDGYTHPMLIYDSYPGLMIQLDDRFWCRLLTHLICYTSLPTLSHFWPLLPPVNWGVTSGRIFFLVVSPAVPHPAFNFRPPTGPVVDSWPGSPPPPPHLLIYLTHFEYSLLSINHKGTTNWIRYPRTVLARPVPAFNCYC